MSTIPRSQQKDQKGCMQDSKHSFHTIATQCNLQMKHAKTCLFKFVMLNVVSREVTDPLSRCCSCRSCSICTSFSCNSKEQS